MFRRVDGEDGGTDPALQECTVGTLPPPGPRCEGRSLLQSRCCAHLGTPRRLGAPCPCPPEQALPRPGPRHEGRSLLQSGRCAHLGTPRPCPPEWALPLSLGAWPGPPGDPSVSASKDIGSIRLISLVRSVSPPLSVPWRPLASGLQRNCFLAGCPNPLPDLPQACWGC